MSAPLLRAIAPFIWCAAVAGSPPAVAASDPQLLESSSGFPTNEDLRHVRSLADPRLAPDGARVLVQVADSTAEGGRTHLWLAGASGSEARQLTFSPESDKAGERHGRWLGSDAVLFLAKRAERTQLFRLPMAGGEARAIELKITPTVDASRDADALPPRKEAQSEDHPEPVPLEVEDFEVAPDAKHVALLARDPETPGEKKQKDAKADVVLVDHDPHGVRLYLLDPATSALTPVAVPADVRHVAWAHDGSQLLVVSAGPNHQDDLGPSARAWRVAVDHPAAPLEWPQVPRTIGPARWSADDREVYFLAQASRDAPPGYADLYALDVSTGQVRNLSGPAHLAGALDGELLALADETWVGLQAGTRSAYARLRQGAFEPVAGETPVISALDCDRAASACVWIGEGPAQPRTLYLGTRPGATAARLALPAMTPRPWPDVGAQVIEWHSDRLTIEGLLFLPPHAAGARLPLIVDVHGGPTGAWTQRFDPLVPFLLGQGFAVLRPNPRGSTGYGAGFVAANKNDLGGGDYRDIMAGTDAVVARFPVDPARLALMGYSYGGEMAGFVEGKTDRFKAVISGAPVIDQQSEYGTEDESWYDRWFYGKPWENVEAAWRQSPLAGVARARSRFLLLQGEADVTDPLGQSLEMYRALRQVGVHVELAQYPRDGHGQLSQALHGMPTTEPWHGLDARRRIVRFIEASFAGP
ncbi:MAG: S9 family peptidase [Proteobacteria bacterium]|nr:S9 family peptidase [Pseudomonadota bacterium]